MKKIELSDNKEENIDVCLTVPEGEQKEWERGSV